MECARSVVCVRCPTRFTTNYVGPYTLCMPCRVNRQHQQKLRNRRHDEEHNDDDERRGRRRGGAEKRARYEHEEAKRGEDGERKDGGAPDLREQLGKRMECGCGTTRLDDIVRVLPCAEHGLRYICRRCNVDECDACALILASLC